MRRRAGAALLLFVASLAFAPVPDADAVVLSRWARRLARPFVHAFVRETRARLVAASVESSGFVASRVPPPRRPPW